MPPLLSVGLYYFVNPHAVGYSSIYPDDLNRFQHGAIALGFELSTHTHSTSGFVAVLVLLDLLLCRHEQVH